MLINAGCFGRKISEWCVNFLHADALVERQQASQRAQEELQTKLQDREAECSRLEKLLAQAQGANANLRSSAMDGEQGADDNSKFLRVSRLCISDTYDAMHAGEKQIENVQQRVNMVAVRAPV